MEFDDDHDDDEQEEEDEDEEINLAAPQSYDSVPHPSVRPRIGQLGGGGGGGGNGGSVAVGGPQSAGRKIGVVGTKYRECLKNHAVNIGGYATDGCGEFMPAGEEGTLDALKCAACNCHRNFHRKETDGGGGDHAVSPAAAAAAVGGGVAGVGALYHALPPYYRTPTPTGYLHVATAGGGGMAVHSPSPAGAHLHRPLALPSPSGGTHSRDEMDDMSHPSSSGGGGGEAVGAAASTTPAVGRWGRSDSGPSSARSRRTRCWPSPRSWAGGCRSTTRRRCSSFAKRCR
ncbi:hypothetical protein Dimus_025007 [Dionaea muscipula]